MNKIVKALGLVVLAAMVVVTIGSCSFFALTVNGTVVNVRADRNVVQYWKGTTNTSATLDGATITLTNMKDSSTVSGTVSSGAYTIVGVSPGKYTMTGSQSGWTFVPREIDITGYAATLPQLLAYETLANAQEIMIMVEWQNNAMDVDSYVTRDILRDQRANGVIIAGYEGTSTNELAGAGNSHHYVASYGYYYDDTYNSYNKVNLERDIVVGDVASQPRVETIHITGAATPDDTLRYYIRLFNQSTGSLTGLNGSSAEATVFVMQGDRDLGQYKIAVNTSECVLGVVQMYWDSTDNTWNIGSFANPIFGVLDPNSSTGNTDLSGVRSLSDGVVVVDAIK